MGIVWPSSICFSHHQCLSSASHAAKETLCVNSLIRKTLTCGSHPLFLLILVGKYFIDFFFFSFFCSSRRREEPRRALCGIRLRGGLLWWVWSWRGSAYVYVWERCSVPPHNRYPSPPTEKTLYRCDPIVASFFLQLLMLNLYLLYNFWLSFCLLLWSIQLICKHLDSARLLFMFPQVKVWWKMSTFL